jgi:hypothetical protein
VEVLDVNTYAQGIRQQDEGVESPKD